MSELRGAIVNAVRGRGGQVERVPAQHTTTTCHACGTVNEFNAAQNLEHTCSSCGTLWDQDGNAADNILGTQLARSRRRVIGESAHDDESAKAPEAPRETRWERARRLAKEKESRLVTVRAADSTAG